MHVQLRRVAVVTAAGLALLAMTPAAAAGPNPPGDDGTVRVAAPDRPAAAGVP